MKERLKRFLAGILLVAILVTSAGISDLFRDIGLDAEVTNITSKSYVEPFGTAIPQSIGIGCLYLYGSGNPSNKDYNIVISDALKKKQVKADGKDRKDGDGKMYFQINSDLKSDPAVNRNWWMLVKNSGYMWDGSNIVEIDTKMYFGSEHKYGSAVEIGGTKTTKISFCNYRCLFNDPNKDSFISKKKFWGKDNANNYYGIKEDNLLLEFEFYKAGTNEKIANPAGVLYFTDIDTGEGWGMGYPSVGTSNKAYVHSKSHLKASDNIVGDTSYKMFRGTETRTGSGLDSSALGLSFNYRSSGGNLKLAYDSEDGWGGSIEPGSKKLNFHLQGTLPKKLTGSSYTESELVHKNFSLTPNVRLEKNTAIYRSLINYHKEVPGYNFSGWKTSSGTPLIAGDTYTVTKDIDLYGSYTPKKIKSQVRVQWQDNLNACRVRPSSLVFGLYKKPSGVGEKKVTSVTVTGSSTGSEWVSSPVEVDLGADGDGNTDWYWKQEGSDIKYSVKNNKSLSKSSNPWDLSQTFTYSLNKLDLTAKKVWQDDGSSRPSSVSVRIKRKFGSTVDSTFSKDVLLNSSNSWQSVVSNLPLLVQNNSECTYYAEEINPPTGYSSSISAGSLSGSTNKTQTVTITNSKSKKASVTVKASWNDNNYTGRPSSLSYELYKQVNGGSKQKVGNGTLYKSSNYTLTHSGLDYVDGTTYSVVYTTPSGYTSSVSVGSMSGSYSKSQTITIANSIPYQTYSVSKTWSEPSSIGTTYRPSSVQVNLYRTYNGVKSLVESITLNSGNSWRASKSVPMFKNSDGTTCTYSWEEVVASGYKSTVSSSGTSTTITNSIGSKTLYVNKNWDMSNSTSTTHPSSVQVSLYRTLDGVKTLVSTETVSTSKSKVVPILYNKDGSECTYEWKESVPQGYLARYNVSGNTTTITNVSKRPDKVSILVRTSIPDTIPSNMAERLTILVESNGHSVYDGDLEYNANDERYKSLSPEDLRKILTSQNLGGYPIETFVTWDVRGKVPDELSNLIDVTSSLSSVKDLTNGDGTITRAYEYDVSYSCKQRLKLNIDVGINWSVDDVYQNTVNTSLYRRLKTSGSSWERIGSKAALGRNNYVASYTNLDRYNGVGQEYEFKTEATHPQESSYYGANSGYSGFFDINSNRILGKSISAMSPLTAVDANTYKATFNVNFSQNNCSGVKVKKEWENIWDKSLVPSVVKAEVFATWYGRSGQHKESMGEVILNSSNGWSGELSNLPRYVYDGSEMEVEYVAEEASAGNLDTYFNKSSNSTTSYVDVVKYANVTLTNTMKNKETMDVTIQKTWDMPYNIAEKPESVTVRLFSVWSSGSRKKVGDYVLSESNNWTTTVRGLEKNWLHSIPPTPDGGGGGTEKIVKYEATELDGNWQQNFTGSVSPTSLSSTGTFRVTNTEKRMRKITVKYVWDDMDNRDGIRPTYGNVTIRDKNGTGYFPYIYESTGWEDTIYAPYYAYATDVNTFTASPGDVNGYSLYEEWNEDPLSYEGDLVYTLTLSHTPSRGTCSASFTKKWKNTAAGVASGYTYPSTLSVSLMRRDVNGNIVKISDKTLSRSGTNSYSCSVGSLVATDENYEPYEYFYTDNSDIDGFTKNEVTTKEGTTFKTVSTSTAGTVTVNVHAIWNDNNDKDNLRPTSNITVRDTKGMVTATLRASSGWESSIANLPTVSNDKLYTDFTVSPADIEGYVKDVSVARSSDSIDVTITYVHASRYASATVRKVWDDSSNSSGDRPESIEVDLYKLGEDYPVGSYVLNSSNNWSVTVDNLPSEGIEKEYYFVETSKEDEGAGEFNYAVSYSYATTEDSYATVITNKYVAPKKTEAKVKVNWLDNNNSAGSRPSQVKVQLVRNELEDIGEPIVLNASNSWSYTVRDLLAESDMGINEYKFVQLEVPFRYTESSSVSGTTTNITNSYSAPEYVSATVRKVWSDNSTKSAKVQLLRDGEEVGDVVTLSSSNNFTYTARNLEKGYGDYVYQYSFKEVDTPAGYTADVVTTKSGSNFNTTITNLYNVKKVSADVEVVWSDSNNVDGLRPDTVMVQLIRNGSTKIGNPVELSSENNFSWSTINLPEEINGAKCTYSYEEVVPEGYTVRYATSGTKTTITNTHTVIPRTSVTVRNVWNDGNDVDKIRPSRLYVDLLCNGEAVDTVELNSSNGWSATVRDLLTKVDGKTAVYTFEASEIDGYTTTYNKSGSTTTITNKHTPIERVSPTVRANWVDNDNKDGVRPSQLSVQFLKNGKVQEVVTLNAANNWQHTESNLPAAELDGTPIVYSYNYVGQPEYYTVNQHNVDGVHVITLTHSAVEYVSPKVKIVWDDSNDEDGMRPSSLDVGFLRNGTQQKVVTLNSSNSWTRQEVDLPLGTLDGETYEYTWEVIKVPVGYTVSHSVSGDTDTITLRHALNARVNPAVEVVWDDDNNKDEVRASSVEVNFMKNGTKVKTVTLSESNNWSHVENSLQSVDTQGNAITYSYELVSVPQYYTQSNKVVGDKNTITLSHTSRERKDYTISIVWNDGDDIDGLRPGKMTLQYGFGVGDEYSGEVDLSSSNSYTHVVRNVPVETIDGNPAEYTGSFKTPTPVGYTSVMTMSDNHIYYTFTHVPAERNDKTVKIEWADGEDRDKVRPSSIDVNLLKGGEVIKTVTLNESNNWSHTEANLPGTTASGETIEYTYEVVSVPKYYTVSTVVSGDTSTITATHVTVPRVDPTIEITWDDGNDSDGVRPGYIEVDFKVNGEVEKTVRLDESNNWKNVESDLPAETLDGDKIEYTYEIKKVPDNYEVIKEIVDGKEVTKLYHEASPRSPKITRVVWDDGNDVDKIRPTSIQVKFNVDGVTQKTVTLNESNSWSHTEPNMPERTPEGELIDYAYEIVTVPQYYTSTLDSSTGIDVFTLVHRTLPRIDRGVSISWDDEDDTDGIRPSKVTVLFKKNGTLVKEVDLSESTNWSHTEESLPAEELNGSKIVYTYELKETPDGYSSEQNTEGNNDTVVLTHKAKRQLTVTQKVPKSDVYGSFGELVFMAKVTGTVKRTGEKVTYYQMLKPVSVTTDSNYYVATYRWEALSTGTYTLSVLPVDRYGFDSIVDNVNCTKEGESVKVDFTTNDVTTASATFISRIKGYEDYTHCGSIWQELK